LHYGTTAANRLGELITLLGLAGLFVSLLGARALNRWRAQRPKDPAPAP
jgi:hypothetical protein